MDIAMDDEPVLAPPAAHMGRQCEPHIRGCRDGRAGTAQGRPPGRCCGQGRAGGRGCSRKRCGGLLAVRSLLPVRGTVRHRCHATLAGANGRHYRASAARACACAVCLHRPDHPQRRLRGVTPLASEIRREQRPGRTKDPAHVRLRHLKRRTWAGMRQCGWVQAAQSIPPGPIDWARWRLGRRRGTVRRVLRALRPLAGKMCRPVRRGRWGVVAPSGTMVRGHQTRAERHVICTACGGDAGGEGRHAKHPSQDNHVAQAEQDEHRGTERRAC